MAFLGHTCSQTTVLQIKTISCDLSLKKVPPKTGQRPRSESEVACKVLLWKQWLDGARTWTKAATSWLCLMKSLLAGSLCVVMAGSQRVMVRNVLRKIGQQSFFFFFPFFFCTRTKVQTPRCFLFSVVPDCDECIYCSFVKRGHIFRWSGPWLLKRLKNLQRHRYLTFIHLD